MREHPPGRVPVVLMPPLGGGLQILVVQDPLVGRRAHDHGSHLREERGEPGASRAAPRQCEQPVQGVVRVGYEPVDAHGGVVLRPRHVPSLTDRQRLCDTRALLGRRTALWSARVGRTVAAVGPPLEASSPARPTVAARRWRPPRRRSSPASLCRSHRRRGAVPQPREGTTADAGGIGNGHLRASIPTKRAPVRSDSHRPGPPRPHPKSTNVRPGASPSSMASACSPSSGTNENGSTTARRPSPISSACTRLDRQRRYPPLKPSVAVTLTDGTQTNVILP